MQKQKELFWSLRKREETADTETGLVLISVLVTKVHHAQGVKKGLILDVSD